MATIIPEHYTTQFGLNWEFLLQQMESRLREYVTVDSVTGKEKSYSQIGTSTARLITTRNGRSTAIRRNATRFNSVRTKDSSSSIWWRLLVRDTPMNSQNSRIAEAG